MVILRITYRLRAHHLLKWEKIFAEQIRPITDEYGLKLQGMWRTVIGEVGEYMEIWEFESLTDFDKRWNALLKDERLLEIFEVTGPMVEGEKFSIMEQAA